MDKKKQKEAIGSFAELGGGSLFRVQGCSTVRLGGKGVGFQPWVSTSSLGIHVQVVALEHDAMRAA